MVGDKANNTAFILSIWDQHLIIYFDKMGVVLMMVVRGWL